MENANVANRIHLTKDTQMASNVHVNKSEQRKKKGQISNKCDLQVLYTWLTDWE